MTQGLYSFSEARHESNGRSIARYRTGRKERDNKVRGTGERSMDRTIRARGTGVHGS